jgi:hypothetical protein
MQPLTHFMIENGISGKAVFTHREVKKMRSMSNATYEVDHYKVVIKMGRRKASFTFFSGEGNRERNEDQIYVVLSCLDSVSTESTYLDTYSSAEEFSEELGDSCPNYDVWKKMEKNAKKLKRLLGEDLYQKLLYETEMN